MTRRTFFQNVATGLFALAAPNLFLPNRSPLIRIASHNGKVLFEKHIQTDWYPAAIPKALSWFDRIDAANVSPWVWQLCNHSAKVSFRNSSGAWSQVGHVYWVGDFPGDRCAANPRPS